MQLACLNIKVACLPCRWIAPEVLAGSHYDRAADVYAFGVILWEILTWEVPWDDLGPWQVIPSCACGAARITMTVVAAHLACFSCMIMTGFDCCSRAWCKSSTILLPAFDRVVPQHLLGQAVLYYMFTIHYQTNTKAKHS